MIGSPGPSFSCVTWLHGIVPSLLLKITGHLQIHHQYSFTNIHHNLRAKQMIYYPPKKGTASKKHNFPPTHELVYLCAGRHGNLIVLCTCVGTKRVLGKPDYAGHSLSNPFIWREKLWLMTPLYLCDEDKFIHAPFSGWVNKIQQDSDLWT